MYTGCLLVIPTSVWLVSLRSGWSCWAIANHRVFGWVVVNCEISPVCFGQRVNALSDYCKEICSVCWFVRLLRVVWALRLHRSLLSSCSEIWTKAVNAVHERSVERYANIGNHKLHWCVSEWVTMSTPLWEELLHTSGGSISIMEFFLFVVKIRSRRNENKTKIYVCHKTNYKHYRKTKSLTFNIMIKLYK